MRHLTLCWYMPPYPPSRDARLVTLAVLATEGRQMADVHESGASHAWSMHVEVQRWSRGWMVRRRMDGHAVEDGDGFMVLPDEVGHWWLLMDGQERGYCWLSLERDDGRGLTHPHQLAIPDGRLVPTGCGPQIDPRYRAGVHDPEDALLVPWFVAGEVGARLLADAGMLDAPSGMQRDYLQDSPLFTGVVS